MSFRDRLLGLLHEYEDLEMRYKDMLSKSPWTPMTPMVEDMLAKFPRTPPMEHAVSTSQDVTPRSARSPRYTIQSIGLDEATVCGFGDESADHRGILDEMPISTMSTYRLQSRVDATVVPFCDEPTDLAVDGTVVAFDDEPTDLAGTQEEMPDVHEDKPLNENRGEGMPNGGTPPFHKDDVEQRQSKPSWKSKPSLFRSYSRDSQNMAKRSWQSKRSLLRGYSRDSQIMATQVMKSMREKQLKRVFTTTESYEAAVERSRSVIEERRKHAWWERLRDLDSHEIEMFVDFWMSFVIVANALFIGIQMDYSSYSREEVSFLHPWHLVDIIFTVIFVFELWLKCFIHGTRSHLCGRDKISNMFDAFVICVDALQLAVSYVFIDLHTRISSSGVPSASMFRVIRLVRLTRLVRLFRTEKFKTLLAMVQGMMSGALTLFWAAVILGLCVYTVALIGRSIFADDQYDTNVEEYFDSVPRSMYTVFRCSYGDCSSKSGTPIPEHIAKEYGPFHALLYCLFTFLVTIGLFNVITAVFVDATVTSAAQSSQRKLQVRLEDETLWAVNVTTIIKSVLLYHCGESYNEMLQPDIKLSTIIDKVSEVEFSADTLQSVVLTDACVREALDALEIDVSDHKRLPDILDPDHNGTITIFELMNGLQRLRGPPRRSDLVTVDLMVRSLQERVDAMGERLVAVVKHAEHSTENAFRQHEKLDHVIAIASSAGSSRAGSTGRIHRNLIEFPRLTGSHPLTSI